MGSEVLVVNIDLREWLDPWDFDMPRKPPWHSSVDEHGANPLFYAIAYLCAGTSDCEATDQMFGRWQGCKVIYPDSQNSIIDGMDCGVVIDSGEYLNLCDFAERTFRNISREVLHEIGTQEPLLLVSMFRNALTICEEQSWSVSGRTLLDLYDEATDEGEWLREEMVRIAILHLDWTREQWDSLIARLRECHAKAEAEWPILCRRQSKEA